MGLPISEKMPAALLSAPAAFSAPFPVPGPFGFAWVAPTSSDCVTWAAVSSGYLDRTRAATPAVSADDRSVVDRVA